MVKNKRFGVVDNFCVYELVDGVEKYLTFEETAERLNHLSDVTENGVSDYFNTIGKVVDLLNLISKTRCVDVYIAHEKDNGILIDGLNNNRTVLFRFFSAEFDWKFGSGNSLKIIPPSPYHDKWNIIGGETSELAKGIFDFTSYDNVFDLDYKLFNYQELRDILKKNDCKQITIKEGHHNGVYSSKILESVVFDGATDIGLALNTSYDLNLDKAYDRLNIHYKYGVFDVYALVAHRITCEDRFCFEV